SRWGIPDTGRPVRKPRSPRSVRVARWWVIFDPSYVEKEPPKSVFTDFGFSFEVFQDRSAGLGGPRGGLGAVRGPRVRLDVLRGLVGVGLGAGRVVVRRLAGARVIDPVRLPYANVQMDERAVRVIAHARVAEGPAEVAHDRVGHALDREVHRPT